MTNLTQQDKYQLVDWITAGDTDQIKKFLSDHPNADLNFKDARHFDSTPLHLASIHEDPEIAKYLVEHGADINAQDKYGNTPLHTASLSGHTNVAKCLIKHGANVNAQDQRGITPLHNASMFGNTDMSQILIENGANINATTHTGHKPLTYLDEYQKDHQNENVSKLKSLLKGEKMTDDEQNTSTKNSITRDTLTTLKEFGETVSIESQKSFNPNVKENGGK